MSRRRHGGLEWWIPFAGGLVLGVVAGVRLAARDRHSRGGEPGRDPSPGWRMERLTRMRDGAADALSEAMDRARARARQGFGEVPEPDVDGLRSLVLGRPGGGDLDVRSLGDGIVEVVGHCPEEDAAADLLAAVAREPGVAVVVNRIWTPASGGPPGGTAAPEDGNGARHHA